jgi:D-cysteine desulfhydrase
MADPTRQVALFRRFPELGGRVPWVCLGDWPTPVEPLASLSRELGGAPLWVKREDRSSSRYGGNKVRTLEAIFGRARTAGADRIWATGAVGSNHCVATVLHAPAAGLGSGAILFPQPSTAPARQNLSALLSARPRLVSLASVLELPFAMSLVRRRSRREGERGYVMPPGGAVPEGTLGALSGGLELAEQIEAGLCPPPERIVLAVGSTCTTAGLLVGVALAARLGLGFRRAPLIHAVRVTPWPVTSAARIAHLAWRSSRLLAGMLGDVARFGARELRAGLRVETDFFGGGYGRPTATGWRARDAFERHGGPPLDVVYSAKAGAALLRLAPTAGGPLLFWATKSSAPLPRASAGDLAAAPSALVRFLDTPVEPVALPG